MSDIKKQIVQELHRPVRRNFPRRSVKLLSIDDLWQADLIEMIPYSRENKGFRYILAVIDCFSKYAWAVGIKRKTAKDVAEAFKVVLSKRKPSNLQTDHGKEFYNHLFKKLVDSHGINHYSTFSNMKASIIERWNKTLKNMLWKEFSLQGSYKWIDVLSSLVKKYNGTKHRTIGMKPMSVSHANESIVAQNYIKKRNKQTPKFKIGDSVRVSKLKTEFRKGYLPNWSTEIFKIHQVKKTNPCTYILKDMRGDIIAGGFYEQEIQKAKYSDVYLVEKILKRDGNRVFVKWLGLNSSHNSWERLSNVNI